MYQKHPIGRGVFPDHPINYAITDILANMDLEIEKQRH